MYDKASSAIQLTHIYFKVYTFVIDFYSLWRWSHHWIDQAYNFEIININWGIPKCSNEKNFVFEQEMWIYKTNET